MSEVKTWQHRINDADFHATREELMQAEINELRAHISALESQEPIGEVSGSDWSTALLWKDREPGSPVYAAAGAAPNVEWNKNIRDSVDKLLAKAGYDKDSSARHQLSMMNFDAAGASPVQKEPFAHLCVILTDAGLTKFFTAPSDPRGFPVYLAAGAAAANEWKKAVLDSLANHGMDAPLTDTPREIVKKLTDMVATMARDPAINAGAEPVQQEQASFPTKDAELWLTKNKLATHGVLGAAPVPNAELAEALEELMSWQVKNVKRWHNAAYDNAARVLKKLEAAPKEPQK
jgi:hypothetical protein